MWEIAAPVEMLAEVVNPPLSTSALCPALLHPNGIDYSNG
jgi:hypothetical protein